MKINPGDLDDHQHYRECEECGRPANPGEWVTEYRCCVGCFEGWYGGKENEMGE